MATFNLLEIWQQSYDIGRPTIYVAGTGTYPDEIPAYWDGSDELALFHLGNTEGTVQLEPNVEFSNLTLTENTGPAIIKSYMTGTSPTFTVGVFGDPRMLKLINPAAQASLGSSRQTLVRPHTLWIAPEQLFISSVPGQPDQKVPVTYTGGVWEKNGNPFTAEEQRLFDMSVFCWKVRFDPFMPKYAHEEGGKSLTEITGTLMHDVTKPEGHMQCTLGAELAGSGIELGGESS